jgi:hypothetical protein
MHKSTIIQLVLIIIGIVAFFNGLENLIGNFVNIAAWFLMTEDRKSDFTGIMIITLLLVSFGYFLLAYFFISRSSRWSVWITKKSKLSPGITAQAPPVELLYFLFVIIGSYMLLKELPRFLGKAYNWFAITVTRNYETGLPPDPRSPWTQSLLSILIPILTILLAKNLAVYFAGKIDSRKELSITDEPGQDAD